jgi:hypothetical protein
MGKVTLMVSLDFLYEEHLKEIGRITVRWSLVDNVMYMILRDRLILIQEANTLRLKSSGKGKLRKFRSNVESSDSIFVHKKYVLVSSINNLMRLYEDWSGFVRSQYGISFECIDGMEVVSSDIGKDDPQLPGNPSKAKPVETTALRAHADAVEHAAQPLRDFLYGRL